MGCLKTDVYNYEKEKIVMALSATHSIAEAARLLGINRTTLQMKLSKFKIKVENKFTKNKIIDTSMNGSKD